MSQPLPKYITLCIITILLLLTFQPALFSQIITVPVTKVFGTNLKSNNIAFGVVEERSYVEKNNLDQDARSLQFDKKMEEVFVFLKSNELTYKQTKAEPRTVNRNGKTPIYLKRVNVEITSGSIEQQAIIQYLEDIDGIVYNPVIPNLDLDDAFMKACFTELEIKGREEAGVYARAQNAVLGKLVETKILKRLIVGKNFMGMGGRQTASKNTHNVEFEVEFSFASERK